MRAELRRYGVIWLRMAAMSMQAQLTHQLGSVGFLVGKLIRLGFFFAFVIAIFAHVDRIAGYDLNETALFFLTYNLVDVTAQVLFRGVYGARRTVTEGDFDFYLIQPCSALFRMVGSMVDLLDMVTLIPILGMTVVVLGRMPAFGWLRGVEFALLTLNGVAIVFAIHVFVAALAVRTQEMENAIWIFRDVMFMGKFPVDIYASPVRWLLTFGLPIAVMTTFPAKAMLGRLSGAWMLYAVVLSAATIAGSLRFWQASVSRYTSSSS